MLLPIGDKVSGTHEEAFIVRVQIPDSMSTQQAQRELEHSIEFGSATVTPMYIVYPVDYFKPNETALEDRSRVP
jgi:hypothetical protein